MKRSERINEIKTHICVGCGKRNASFKKCPDCNIEVWCSKECMDKYDHREKCLRYQKTFCRGSKISKDVSSMIVGNGISEMDEDEKNKLFRMHIMNTLNLCKTLDDRVDVLTSETFITLANLCNIRTIDSNTIKNIEEVIGVGSLLYIREASPTFKKLTDNCTTITAVVKLSTDESTWFSILKNLIYRHGSVIGSMIIINEMSTLTKFGTIDDVPSGLLLNCDTLCVRSLRRLVLNMLLGDIPNLKTIRMIEMAMFISPLSATDWDRLMESVMENRDLKLRIFKKIEFMNCIFRFLSNEKISPRFDPFTILLRPEELIIYNIGNMILPAPFNISFSNVIEYISTQSIFVSSIPHTKISINGLIFFDALDKVLCSIENSTPYGTPFIVDTISGVILPTPYTSVDTLCAQKMLTRTEINKFEINGTEIDIAPLLQRIATKTLILDTTTLNSIKQNSIPMLKCHVFNGIEFKLVHSNGDKELVLIRNICKRENYCPKLETITLSTTYDEKTSINNVVEELRNWPTLKRFEIIVDIDNPDRTKIHNMVYKSKDIDTKIVLTTNIFCNLESLFLSGCTDCRKWLSLFYNIKLESLRNFSVRMECTDGDRGSIEDAFLNIKTSFPKLESFSLIRFMPTVSNETLEESLCDTAMIFPNLVTLFITDICTKLNPAGITLAKHNRVSMNFPKLTLLNYVVDNKIGNLYERTQFDIPSYILQRIMKACPKLNELEINIEGPNNISNLTSSQMIEQTESSNISPLSTFYIHVKKWKDGLLFWRDAMLLSSNQMNARIIYDEELYEKSEIENFIINICKTSFGSKSSRGHDTPHSLIVENFYGGSPDLNFDVSSRASRIWDEQFMGEDLFYINVSV